MILFKKFLRVGEKNKLLKKDYQHYCSIEALAVSDNEWLYVFGFATHILLFKAQNQLAKLTYTTCYMLGGKISRNLIK